MSRGPLAPVVKGVAATIGLVSEYRHHRQTQADKTGNPVLDDNGFENESHIPANSGRESSAVVSELTALQEDASTELLHDDEVEWSLDEAQDTVVETAAVSKQKVERNPTKMTDNFITRHMLPKDYERHSLALPVVLPQRRPKDRTRGFIRAYAPVLHDSGIEQEEFLEFLEVFNTATLASPWLDAINLASLALVTLPTAISQAVSIAIAIAVDITKNMQSRHRHGYIIDQLNRDYFRPRGLYALILTWKPESDDMSVSVNLDEVIKDNLAERTTLLDKAQHSFRPSMGNTVGLAFAETAPLIFPALDSLVNSETKEATELKQKMKNAKGLIAEYFDRRAQAEYAGQNPDSQLNVTKPVFTSRYSDPNNPTNSGDLLSLISGGALSRPNIRGSLRQRFSSQRSSLIRGRGFSRFQQYQQPINRSDPYYDDQTQPQVGISSTPSPLHALRSGPIHALIGGGVKRVFQHHVLYLAIMNMPSEEELDQAKEYLTQLSTETEN